MEGLSPGNAGVSPATPGNAGVSPATLFLATAYHPGPLPRTARQTGLCGVLIRRAIYGAGGTPAFPGGVPLVTLFVQTASDPGLLPRTAR